MERRLTSMNPCSCLLLTQIPQRNHSRMKRGEWETSLLALEGVQLEGTARERENWRRGGNIYTPWPKNSRWANSYPETPGICPETPGNPNFSAREQHPDTPGKGVRSIRPCTRSIRVRQDENSCFALLSVFCGSQMFVWVLLSTRFKSKPLNQVPLNSTASLYSNFKYKI